MFWPLIGGLVALIIITLLLGRLTEAPRNGHADEHRH